MLEYPGYVHKTLQHICSQVPIHFATYPLSEDVDPHTASAMECLRPGIPLD